MEDLEAFPATMVLDAIPARLAGSNDSQKRAVKFALAHFGSMDVHYLVARIRDAADGIRIS